MDRERVFAAATDERHQIADLIANLDDFQLATPSLCPGWDIKTVVAHLVSTILDGMAAFIWMTLRHGSVDRGVNKLALRRAQQPTSLILSSLRQSADRQMSPPGAGPLDPLMDVLVHSGDIRIPLGLSFQPDKERAALALDFLTGPWRFAVVPRSLLKRLSLQATDVEQSWRNGAEIRGPVAALMMAAAGRTALLDTLDGPGVPTLRGRIKARR